MTPRHVASAEVCGFEVVLEQYSRCQVSALPDLAIRRDLSVARQLCKSSPVEIELPNGGVVRLPVGVGQAVIVDVIQAVTGLQTKRKPLS